MIDMFIWLVVEHPTPLKDMSSSIWNIWLRQLGWLNSPWKTNVQNHRPDLHVVSLQNDWDVLSHLHSACDSWLVSAAPCNISGMSWDLPINNSWHFMSYSLRRTYWRMYGCPWEMIYLHVEPSNALRWFSGGYRFTTNTWHLWFKLKLRPPR